MLPSETPIAKVDAELRRRDRASMVRVDLPQDWQVPEPAAIEPKPRWRPSLRMIGAIAAIYALGLLAYALAPLF